MSDAHNPHDKCFKTVMQTPENAHAFFQHYLEPQWKNTLDLDTLELQSGSMVTSNFEALYTDILYRVKFRHPEVQGDGAYLYTLVEHQSTADSTMDLRLLEYKINLLMQHAHEAYLPPIHTMVFYHGQQTPYPYNLDVRTRFHTPEQAEHTLQGPPQLIDIQQQTDAELFQKDRAGLLSYFFKHVRDNDILPALEAIPAEFLGKITQNTSGISLLETLMTYYQIKAKTAHPAQAFQQVAEKLEPQQQEHIMNIGEALIAQGRDEGIQTGMQQGRQEGRQEGMQQGKQEGMYAVASNMLRAGTDLDFIQRMTGLPLETIRNVAT